MLPGEFLKLVLPQEGKKCWVALKAKDKTFRRQGFVDTFEELAEKLQQLSASGLDAYFGCATFKDDSSRRAHNAYACQAFWLDIDCGAGKPYATADDGIQAVDDFSNRRGFNLPVVIRSGSGIHAYWLLDVPMPADAWLAAAKNFKRLTEIENLQADPSRTADLASILRPPGTLNYKHAEALPVSVEESDIEFMSPADFVARLSNLPAVTSPMQALVKAGEPLAVAAAIMNSAKGNSFSLTEGCKEGGRNNKCASLAGHLLGESQRKSPEEALALLLEWNKLNVPPMEDIEVANVVRSIAEKEAHKPPPPPIATSEEEVWPRPVLPDGFAAKSGGAMFAKLQTEKDDGTVDERWVPISAYELYLVDVCRREREDKGSYVFFQYHPHNGWHKFLVGTGEFESAGWLSVMAEHSTDIMNPKLFKQYVKTAAIEFKRNKMDAIRYEQFGWKDNYNAFLVGNALIKRGGETTFAYGDGSLEPRMQYMRLQKGTSLAEWSRAANKLYAMGFEAHGFSLLASFAAPLMTFVCGATDGGAVLALHSQGSGFGKSNILQAIASVWGQFDGLSTSGSDTENAKFNIISKACHLPVYEEELDKMDPIKAAAVLKRFVEGRDKNRSQRDGTVAVKNTRFQTIMISASNHSLFEILQRSGDQGAMARVLEIDFAVPGDKEAFKEFSKVTSTMLYNHGHAGRVFIASLMHPGVLEWVRKTLDDLVSKYINAFHTEGKDRYVIYLLATCQVAAAIVNSAGILNFDIERIMDWARDKARERIREKISDTGPEIINQFIAAHAEDCLTVQRPFNNKTENPVVRYPRNKVAMRMEKSTERLYIPTENLRRWCAANHHNYSSVMRGLEVKGVLLNKNRMTSLTAGTDYPPARVLCWELAMDATEMSGLVQLVSNNPDVKQNSASHLKEV